MTRDETHAQTLEQMIAELQRRADKMQKSADLARACEMHGSAPPFERERDFFAACAAALRAGPRAGPTLQQLKAIEWSADALSEAAECCPVCHAVRPGEDDDTPFAGHDLGCWLADAIVGWSDEPRQVVSWCKKCGAVAGVDDDGMCRRCTPVVAGPRADGTREALEALRHEWVKVEAHNMRPQDVYNSALGMIDEAIAALAASPAPAPTTPPWLATKSDAISVIELHHAEENCYICNRVARLGYGVPVYESEILPDDDKGEWGGQHVCAACYLLVRGILAEWPGHRVPTSFARRLAAPPDTGPQTAPGQTGGDR